MPVQNYNKSSGFQVCTIAD